jgi:hypothetical protein
MVSLNCRSTVRAAIDNYHEVVMLSQLNSGPYPVVLAEQYHSYGGGLGNQTAIARRRNSSLRCEDLEGPCLSSGEGRLIFTA